MTSCPVIEWSILSVKGLERFELTPYFERRVVNDPEGTMTQPDGKVRY
jgi:hypothetical protein